MFASFCPCPAVPQELSISEEGLETPVVDDDCILCLAQARAAPGLPAQLLASRGRQLAKKALPSDGFRARGSILCHLIIHLGGSEADW